LERDYGYSDIAAGSARQYVGCRIIRHCKIEFLSNFEQIAANIIIVALLKGIGMSLPVWGGNILGLFSLFKQRLTKGY
jgi:hypothetical protein